jgi:protoheme IX farnesyltransferase
MSWLYLIGALGLGGCFLWMAWKLLQVPSKALARKTFFFSLWYLAGLFAVMVSDRIILG